MAFAWIGVLLLPTAIGGSVLGGIRLYREWSAHRPSAPVPGQPIELLAADLCRLHAAVEAAENDMTHTLYKAARVRAVRGAYLDALRDACKAVGISPPASRAEGIPVADIYRTEVALRKCGLDVRCR
ncbi:MAG: hypothetical protein JO242_28300 [Streptosporangiaceae bacterium]|nr:hypothetical protein [Streptosporangiaceae bacterium]